jgi:hypothetical protein
MASLYELGEGVWVRGSFTNPVTGVPEDPSAVTVAYLSPSGLAHAPVVMVYGVDPEVVQESLGVYALLLTADEVGLWQYRWEGENSAPAVHEGSFIVRRTELA